MKKSRKKIDNKLFVGILLIIVILIIVISFSGKLKEVFNIGEEDKLEGELGTASLFEVSGPSLIAHYEFEDDEAVWSSGKRRTEKSTKTLSYFLVKDSSGNNNNGKFYGGRIRNYVDGKNGKGLSLDGVDDYIYIPHSSDFNSISNEMSFSAWIKPAQIKLSSIIIKGADMEEDFEMLMDDNGDIFSTFDGASSRFQNLFQTNLIVDEWVHIMITYKNNGDWILYKDGSPVDILSGSQTLKIDSVATFVGREAGPNRYFNGLIDNVGIWNYALSQEEVLAEYGGVEVIPDCVFTPTDYLTVCADGWQCNSESNKCDTLLITETTLEFGESIKGPHIHNNYITWTHHKGPDLGTLFLCDLTKNGQTGGCLETDEKTTITENHADYSHTDSAVIYGNKLLWSEIIWSDVYDDYVKSLHMLNLDTLDQRRITPFSYSANYIDPSIYENIIIWSEWHYSTSTIFMCDLTKDGQTGGCEETDTKTIIETLNVGGYYGIQDPKIHGNIISWGIDLGGTMFYMCDLTKNGQTGGCEETDEKVAIESEWGYVPPIRYYDLGEDIIVWPEYSGPTVLLYCHPSKNGQDGGCKDTDLKNSFSEGDHYEALPSTDGRYIVWTDFWGVEQGGETIEDDLFLCDLTLNGQDGGCSIGDLKTVLYDGDYNADTDPGIMYLHNNKIVFRTGGSGIYLVRFN